MATGSVVDGLSEGDLASMTVPYTASVATTALADQVEAAWADFARASAHAATDALEQELAD
ncbi:MAG: hypothetical protein QOF58_8704 [Pseudonocardiales bacterium]|nr:hypothetical protein [Pseudonocardiales bacterium]